MSLSQIFQRKIKLDMKLIHVIDKKPKLIVKLDQLDPEDFIVSHESISEWSENNQQLYQIILENGMAEHVCNKQYLYQFYRHLSFHQQQIFNIDETTLKFKNLEILSLLQNNINTIQNIPASCKQLYVDFNSISSIKLKQTHSLQLLSISNNIINDQTLVQIVSSLPELRCLNISWNKIQNLKQFVTNLASLHKLKILISFANPISMLAIYYTYITQHLKLSYIDGSKYIKVEEIKKQQPPKVQEKKEVKQQKKQAKKDNKKGAKVQEKPPEQPPKIQLPKQVPKKQLNKQDFEQVRLRIKISNIQKFSGNIYDISLFPPDTDVAKIQTTYWVKFYFFDQQVQQKHKIKNFDNATIENDEIRLNLDIEIFKVFSVNYENFLKFNKGLKIEVIISEPKMIKDSETLQLKPEIKDNSVVMHSSVLGATHIDLRKLHTLNKKQEKAKFILFNAEAVRSPLFSDPYEDQSQLINQRKQKFNAKLKKQEEERQKKIEEEEILKQQKKGGKDQKKAADKKAPAKKDGKQPVVEKIKSQKCDFPIQPRQYCIIDSDRMYKGKELLCIYTKIQ